MVDKTAIRMDAPETITAAPGEDAEASFLRAYTADAEKPSESDEDTKKKVVPPVVEPKVEASEETPEEDAEDEDDVDSSDEDDDEDDEEKVEKPSGKRVVLEPDAEAFVKHKVDGKDVEIPVKDLTRLFGQEAALTRKSQENAEARKAVDEQGARYTAGLEALMNKALERFKPYADLNFLALAKDPDITAEDLAALQKQATDAYNDVTFLNTKLDETVQAVSQTRHTNLVKAAGEAWKVLSNPETGISGWNDTLYNEIRAYTKEQGIPAKQVDELVDPFAVKLLHKAMLYDRQVAKPPVKIVKVDKEPKKIIKSSSDAIVQKSKGKGVDGAMAKLAKTGSVEDAQDAFLAMMATK